MSFEDSFCCNSVFLIDNFAKDDGLYMFYIAASSRAYCFFAMAFFEFPNYEGIMSAVKSYSDLFLNPEFALSTIFFSFSANFQLFLLLFYSSNQTQILKKIEMKNEYKIK